MRGVPGLAVAQGYSAGGADAASALVAGERWLCSAARLLLAHRRCSKAASTPLWLKSKLCCATPLHAGTGTTLHLAAGLRLHSAGPHFATSAAQLHLEHRVADADGPRGGGVAAGEVDLHCRQAGGAGRGGRPGSVQHLLPPGAAACASAAMHCSPPHACPLLLPLLRTPPAAQPTPPRLPNCQSGPRQAPPTVDDQRDGLLAGGGALQQRAAGRGQLLGCLGAVKGHC